MFRRSLRTITVAAVVVILGVLSLQGQDAGQVLSLSVAYTTLKNTAKVSDERGREVEQIEARAREASRARQYGDALRHYYHAMALLRDQVWTPSRALTTAMRLKTDRVFYDPGDVVRVQITQIFGLEEPLKGPLSGTLALTRTAGTATETVAKLKDLSAVSAEFQSQAFTVEAKLPSIDDGAYQIALTLKADSGEPMVKSAPLRILRGVTARAAAIRARIASLPPQFKTNMLAAAEYPVELLDLVNKGESAIGQLDIKAELANASSILDQLAKGENPLRSKRGDFRWAYRSAVDNTLQPYRIYVPSTFDPEKAYPLVVVLHGMNGDENSMFTSYSDGIIKEEAETRGYLLVCPKGRAPTSMYRGAAERDVMDVLAAMKRDYRIDPERVYLMGHSMGGYGTWSVAMSYPDAFTAIAPISGGGQAEGLSKIRHIPELVVHGDKDPTVNVSESRKMVAAAKQLGIEVEYIEVPGGDHSSVVVPHLKDAFDWFDAHKRRKTPGH